MEKRNSVKNSYSIIVTLLLLLLATPSCNKDQAKKNLLKQEQNGKILQLSPASINAYTHP